MKHKRISSMPVVRLVSHEAECKLKAKLFAARRERYQEWFASQSQQSA